MVLKASTLSFKSCAGPRMSTTAASTPSAEVPDMSPITFIGAGGYAKARARSRNWIGSQYNDNVDEPENPGRADVPRGERSRHGTRIHRPRQDGHEHGPAAAPGPPP